MNALCTILLVLLFTPQDTSRTRETAEKAARIRAELLNSTSLPPSIIRPENSSKPSFSEKYVSFIYYTYRKENNSVDSVIMIVTSYSDSSEHLSFNETNLKNNTSIMYKVNKYGIIDWAYRADGEPEPRFDKNGKITGATLPQQTIDINTDPANYNYAPQAYPIKTPDTKTYAFYSERLIASLEELEKMLFEK